MSKKEPKKITPEEANKLEDYAQSLEDEVTHTVDYGGLEKVNKKKRKKDA